MSILGEEIAALIRTEGPLPVSRYMGLCLGHPRHGYYITRDPLGTAGDFTTAPEISQIFGELIGLWAAHVWQAMGAPATVRLVELGPGRGTLMADILRAAKVLPAFRAAIEVHLVETSPVLRATQARALEGVGAVWHEDVSAALDGPAIVIANEFLDALPVDQFVRTEEGWRERLIGLGEGGELAWGLGSILAVEPQRTPSPLVGEGRGEGSRDASDLSFQASEAKQRDPSSVPASPGHLLPQGEKESAPIGAIYEHPQAALDVVASVSRHVAGCGGGALFIDYGSIESGVGDTLQAMRAHEFVDPFADPGEADLTVHVDFARMGQAARAAGAATHGPAAQRDFLLSLGLAERAQALARRASEAQRETILKGAERLVAPGPTEMGDLFKVMALSHPDLPPLPGFDRHLLPEQLSR